MHFDEYQDQASSTAIYPGQGTVMGLAYVALGVNGEAGEIAEYVKKAWRDDRPREDGVYLIRADRRRKILAEVGDVLWYLSQVCRELDSTLEEAAQANITKLASRRERQVIHGDGDDR